MAHTIVGKLNKDATVFDTQNGTGFGVRVGVYYDRDTKQKEWTNYEAVIFANQPTQAQFYKDVLVAGSVIEISGESLKVKQFQGQNGLSLSLEIIGAKLGYTQPSSTATQQQRLCSPTAACMQQPRQQPQQQAYAPQQPQYQQQHTAQGLPLNQGFAQPQQQQQQDWDKEIPF